MTNKRNRGVATLPTIMLMGVLILAVGIGILSLAFSENLMSASQANSSSALFYADAGARDALIRIARNKNYNCTAPDCYTIDIATNGCSTGNGCAKVSVGSGTGATGDPKIITSKGLMGGNTRTLQVSVYFDSALYGQISTTTTAWQEITN